MKFESEEAKAIAVGMELGEAEEELNKKDNNDITEVAPALIAVHPLHPSVAVAVGPELRVFDLL